MGLLSLLAQDVVCFQARMVLCAHGPWLPDSSPYALIADCLGMDWMHQGRRASACSGLLHLPVHAPCERERGAGMRIVTSSLNKFGMCGQIVLSSNTDMLWPGVSHGSP